MVFFAPATKRAPCAPQLPGPPRALLAFWHNRNSPPPELQHLGAALDLLALHRGDFRHLGRVVWQAAQHLQAAVGQAGVSAVTKRLEARLGWEGDGRKLRCASATARRQHAGRA